MVLCLGRRCDGQYRAHTRRPATYLSHMGISLESDDENECECRTSSRSRESSRSTEGIVCGLVEVQYKAAVECVRMRREARRSNWIILVCVKCATSATSRRGILELVMS